MPAELTFIEFSNLFPWNKELTSITDHQEFPFLWNYDLDISQEDLWFYIMDSSRFNRALGYEGIEYKETEGKLFGFKGEGKFREEWIEFPFEWQYPNFISRTRKYNLGISEYNQIVFYSESKSIGIRVYVYISSLSKINIAKKFIPAYLNPFKEKYGNMLKEIERSVKSKKKIWETFTPEKIKISEDGLELFAKYKKNLSNINGINQELVSIFFNYIVEADRNLLSRIQPLVLAKEWGIEINDILKLFLHSVQIGFLTLTWDVICPHCRGVKSELPSLGKVPSKGNCEVCEISFENNEINSLEITFHLNSAIINIPRIFYCSSEMSKKPHIYLQRNIAPGDFSLILKVNLMKEDLRIRIKKHSDLSKFKISIHQEKSYGEISIVGTNYLDEMILLNVEEVSWGKDRLTPPMLFNFQEFRDLFTEEHLSSDLQLNIGLQTIVFTDIVGSTKFYEQEGDAKAFIEVQKHFQLIFKAITKHSGAVIKTVGDGAMIAFGIPISALKAVLEIKDIFLQRENFSPVKIKISVHRGNCLAVNLNTGVDYFGQTVNFAAKLQNGVLPNSIAISEDFYKTPEIRNFIDESLISVKKISIDHSSLSNSVSAFLIH